MKMIMTNTYVCLVMEDSRKLIMKNPIVPHNLKNTCVNAGAKFLKCLPG